MVVVVLGGVVVEGIGRLGPTYIHYHVSSGWLVGGCCIAQGAHLVLCDYSDGWDGREGTYVYM